VSPSRGPVNRDLVLDPQPTGAIRRGAFTSLQALIDAIQRFLDAWNESSRPFVWVKSAQQILATMHRPFKNTVH